MTVFANMMEVSAKKQGCKIIAAFPDVCFTPPQTPATPPGVPIPYPNFGMDSDLASGSSTVKIGGEPISQENASNYSKISGDEAGAAPKKGIITSKNMGKAYAQMWSMDVKADGKGVVRFGDIATSNHASNTGDTPPSVFFGGMEISLADCPKILASVGLSTHAHDDKEQHCNYKDSSKAKQQSDHVPQATCFTTGTRDDPGQVFPNGPYDIGAAPCVCLEDGSSLTTEHGRKSEFQKWQTTVWKRRNAKTGWTPTFKDAKRADLNAIRYAKSPTLNPDADGNPHPALKCLEIEINKYFDKLGVTDDTPVAIPNQGYTPEKFTERVAKFRKRMR
jgi:hypothetical protein